MKIFLQTAPDTVKKYVNYAERNNLNIELADFHHPELLNSKKQLNNHIRYVKKLLQNFNGILSMHGPFFSMDFITKDSLILKAVKRQLSKFFKVADSLQADFVILHSPYNPLITSGSYDRFFVTECVKFFSNFLLETDYKGIVLFENIWEPVPDLLIDITKKLSVKPDINFEIITDIGHINVFGSISMAEWIKKVSSCCRYFHFSNNFGKKDDHYDLFNGSINIEKVVQHIMTNISNPHITLEVHDNFEFIVDNVKFLKSINK
ncbi:MAG: TIM barrel protein [Candidatus Muiribacteriota bacterium]